MQTSLKLATACSIIWSISVLLHVAVTPAFSDPSNRASPSEIQWSKYAAKTFSSHLNEEERKQLSAALSSLDCDEVARLQTEGFVRKHHDLGNDVSSDDPPDDFRDNVILSLADYRYCADLKDLNGLLALATRKNFKVAPVDLSPRPSARHSIEAEEEKRRNKASLEERTQNSICQNYYRLLNRAISDGDPLSTKFMLERAKDKTRVRLGASQSYLLQLQVAMLDGASFEYAQAKISLPLFHKVRSDQRHMIELHVKKTLGDPSLENARILVVGVAPQTCDPEILLPSDYLRLSGKT